MIILAKRVGKIILITADTALPLYLFYFSHEHSSKGISPVNDTQFTDFGQKHGLLWQYHSFFEFLQLIGCHLVFLVF
jgi:hypothetical protein